MEQFPIPRHFFATSGVAQDGASELNAFDIALQDADIGQCNLVEVSSILPSEATEIEPIEIPPGAVMFCVMAKMPGTSGETIGCGLGWAWGTTPDGTRFGIVAEHHCNCGEEELEDGLRRKLYGMAVVRNLTLEEIKTRTCSTVVKESMHGCVVTVLVFTN
jgi:arginine decarboxylase